MKNIALVSLVALCVACAPPAASNNGGGAGRADAGPANTPECTTSRDCADDERCIEEACVPTSTGCQNDTDCPLGERCNSNGACEAVPAGGCSSAADCEPGQQCEAGACKSGAYGTCTDDAGCLSGTACLIPLQGGQRVCGTVCTSTDQCTNAETCAGGQVCMPNICENPGQTCDAHGTGDGQCISFGQQSFCVKGAADCSPFGDGQSCGAGESCQPVSPAGSDMFCAQAGTAAVGGACAVGLLSGRPFASDDCAQASVCVALQNGSSCVPYCRVGNNADCPAIQGQTLVCRALADFDQQLAGSPWGLCVPPQ